MVARPTVESEKLRRIRDGKPPRVLDLFSGCGGFSLGFQQAGFEIVGGVESDPDACRTYAANLHPTAEGAALDRHLAKLDITQTSPAQALQHITSEEPDRAIDVVIGGPPCPAFTRVGRAKLRSITGRDDAHIVDPRAQLWRVYLQYVQALRPVAVVLENVPDMLRWNQTDVAAEISRALRIHGFDCRYALLNTAHYGLPQFRTRLFLVGLHASIDDQFAFPAPSHFGDVPKGYLAIAMAAIQREGMAADAAHLQPPLADVSAAPFVTFADAVADLPDVDTNSLTSSSSLVSPQNYAGPPTNTYSTLMRSDTRNSSPEPLTAHTCRHPSRRDRRIFAAMKPGEDYPRALAAAQRMLDARLTELAGQGHIAPSVLAALRQDYVPPYCPTKFRNKWWKIDPQHPTRTLTAHLGKDCYTHIHPTASGRTITVREAARLQGFPDRIRFPVGLNAAFRQIGNAVPPILGHRIAAALLQRIRADFKR